MPGLNCLGMSVLRPEIFRRLALRYPNPGSVQKLIRSFEYNKKHSMRSALSTWKQRSGHCLETTFLAAAILEHRGYPPLILSLDSADNVGHVLLLFKRGGRWGSISRSREDGLHGRAPVFRSIRDLAWSYVDPYVDDSGGRVVAFAAGSLDESGSRWRDSEVNVWKCERYVLGLKHERLKASPQRHRRALKAFAEGRTLRQDHWW